MMSRDGRRASRSGAKRILVVDDQPIIRFGIKETVNREPDLVVAGEAGTLKSARTLLHQGGWQLVIVDLYLDGEFGVELIKDVRMFHPQLPMLAISFDEEPVMIQRALGAGAKGCWHKSEEVSSIVRAIRTVLAGDTFLSDRLRMDLKQIAPRQGANGKNLGVVNLSDRELEVFELIGHGYSTRQISESLNLGFHSVETMRSRMKIKLGITTAPSLVAEAVRWFESRRSSSSSAHRPL